LGEYKDDNSRIFIDNNSVDLIVDTGGTDVTEASFGATTTIGGTSGQHISIDSDSFDVKTNSSTTVASFGATTTIRSTSGEHVSISSDAVEIKTDANTTGLICFICWIKNAGGGKGNCWFYRWFYNPRWSVNRFWSK
jgi:hypothetical protein